jgi:hypothetical protein
MSTPDLQRVKVHHLQIKKNIREKSKQHLKRGQANALWDILALPLSFY